MTADTVWTVVILIGYGIAGLYIVIWAFSDWRHARQLKAELELGRHKANVALLEAELLDGEDAHDTQG